MAELPSGSIMADFIAQMLQARDVLLAAVDRLPFKISRNSRQCLSDEIRRFEMTIQELAQIDSRIWATFKLHVNYRIAIMVDQWIQACRLSAGDVDRWASQLSKGQTSSCSRTTVVFTIGAVSEQLQSCTEVMEIVRNVATLDADGLQTQTSLSASKKKQAIHVQIFVAKRQIRRQMNDLECLVEELERSSDEGEDADDQAGVQDHDLWQEIEKCVMSSYFRGQRTALVASLELLEILSSKMPKEHPGEAGADWTGRYNLALFGSNNSGLQVYNFNAGSSNLAFGM